MEAHGLAADPSLTVVAKAFSIEEGLRTTRTLLERGDCTAVAAANDMLAMGCFAALEEAGLNCPANLSVVGFNDMPFIDRLRPPLTTIRFPHYQVGTEAAQLLLELISDGSGPVKVLYLAPELVVRGSTAPMAELAAGQAGQPVSLGSDARTPEVLISPRGAGSGFGALDRFAESAEPRSAEVLG
jgi:LacI family transcriptional regulator